MRLKEISHEKSWVSWWVKIFTCQHITLHANDKPITQWILNATLNCFTGWENTLIFSFFIMGPSYFTINFITENEENLPAERGKVTQSARNGTRGPGCQFPRSRIYSHGLLSPKRSKFESVQIIWTPNLVFNCGNWGDAAGRLWENYPEPWVTTPSTSSSTLHWTSFWLLFCMNRLAYGIETLCRNMEGTWWWEWGGLGQLKVDSPGLCKILTFCYALQIQKHSHFCTKKHGWCTINHVNSETSCSLIM